MFPSHPTSLSGDALAGQTVGRYRVVEKIGEGGMGVVYRARDERLGREVALKLLAPRLSLDDRARQRMMQEARAAAALDHPHVASVYDVGEDDGRLYIAMAYYQGETLEARLGRGVLDPDEALTLGTQIARGLGAAHRAGIVHRDVKPGNVMVLADAAADGGTSEDAPRDGVALHHAPGGPSARVLDFGIASVPDASLTQTGESLGTSLYMSPEHLRGETVDARSDVWAWGVTMYEALAGHRPFAGAYAAALGYAVLHQEPAPLADVRDDVPDGMSDTVHRCLSKDPADRYASGDALADALDRLRQPGVGEHPGAPTKTRRRTGLGRRAWAGAALAVAVVTLGLASVMSQAPSAVAEPQRLAVLSFRAIGPDAQPLSDGLVETVTSKLSQLGSLRDYVRVVPASEVGAQTTPSQAHERFDASLVIEGTVQAEGGRVRVTMTLVDVGGGAPTQLGTREIDDASGSVFALQDAAVLEVAALLRDEGGLAVTVAEADRQSLAAGGTRDPQANELFLRGRGVLRNQQGPADLQRARALFAEALSIDPDFALAHAALAEAEWQTYQVTSEVAWADRATASAQRALALDDGLADVHTALGAIYAGRGETGQALASLDRALALDPRHVEATRQLGKAYAADGRAAEAEAALRRAVALAPDTWLPINSLGSFYLNESRVADAAEQFQRGLALQPTNLTLLYNLGVAASQQGNFQESEQAFERVIRLDPEHASAFGGLISDRFYLGDFAGAVTAGERAVELLPDSYDTRLALAEARRWAPGQHTRATGDYRAALALARDHLTVGRTPSVLLSLASAFAGLGQADSARVYLAEVERQVSPADATVRDAYALGVTYEIVGDRDRAFVWVSSATARGFARSQIDRSPWLADFRMSPQYRSLPFPSTP